MLVFHNKLLVEKYDEMRLLLALNVVARIASTCYYTTVRSRDDRKHQKSQKMMDLRFDASKLAASKEYHHNEHVV